MRGKDIDSQFTKASEGNSRERADRTADYHTILLEEMPGRVNPGQGLFGVSSADFWDVL